jgi:hypothetical protein
VSEQAEGHRAAAERHDEGVERFLGMAEQAGKRGDFKRRELFRRAAHLEREFADLERDWAALDEAEPPSE